ncbi:hypothetical protein HYH03_001156 [Edaphochlamys debaryana]|uniref:Uncharacterized protein n=1 Tax=Edaphochlamys debaryana TaxID=47281 RepID=A0A835YI37_9CHLO|nr:hypothetical protein HYH03_001156 [Edaphochlamys debaryana]|eukprot:KAG2501366.1 hypothetical protein HYH03_001156 [Edaphochlamys debaryana]
MSANIVLNTSSISAQRRRLEPPPGQGAPADAVTLLLCNPTLLAKALPAWEEEAEEIPSGCMVEPHKSLGHLRRVSTDAQAAFDAAWEGPLIFAPQRQRYYSHVLELRSPRPSLALGWTLGMLRRGRRPKEVRIGVNERVCPEKWRQGGLDLLRAIPQLSGRPGEGVATLELPAQLLSPSTAPLIAGAFPNLARLELSDSLRLSPEVLQSSARGLALLLGVPSEAEGGGEGPPAADAVAPGAGTGGGAGSGAGATAAASGEASAGAGGDATGGSVGAGLLPLLPRLTELGLTGPPGLPPGFTWLLQQATQLRTLELRAENYDYLPDLPPGRAPLDEIASLTQLSALSLHSCDVPPLPALIGDLTGLTSLELSSLHGSHSPAIFAPLQGLQRLEVPRASLEVTGLAEALSSLTRLSVKGFTLSAQELSQPLTSIPRWRLPAGLRELGLGIGEQWVAVHPEVLAGLELPAGLRLEHDSTKRSFVLIPGRHTAPPVEEDGFAGTELLPAAEEALCGALRFVLLHGLQHGHAGKRGLLKGGRPNHGRWLREVAALGPTRLTLEGISLSYQDVEAIVEHMADMGDLEALAFERPSKLPLPALPLLAGLPRLKDLALDAIPWAGDDEDSSELRGQALSSIVALARARPEGRDLALDLRCGEEDAEAWARVQALAVRSREEMVALGVRPLRLAVEGIDLYLPPVPPDAEDGEEAD